MGKIWVEVCLISARGLRRKSSLWKLQWFAVGWIDPENKYCTKINTSRNGNPVWKTKFSMAVDVSESNFQELALNVEVYCREPIFLRESLLGTATIVLKEFLDKYKTPKSEVSKPVEEVGSFQLRKRNSNKPRGLVDISIRNSEEKEEHGNLSYPARGNPGFDLTDHKNGGGRIKIATRHGHFHSQMPHHPETSDLVSVPLNYSHHPSATEPNYPTFPRHSYQSTPTPPPPSNVGYVPNFFPRTGNFVPSGMPPPPGRGVGPGFGIGIGAGALAGALIFVDDFMSGFDLPTWFCDDASLTISTDPPF